MPASRLATIQKSTIVRSFALLERVAPALGARWAERLWFRIPAPRARHDRPVEPGRPFRLRVDGRTVAGEVWGYPSAEAVYLVHGWGGWREQLDAFVEPLTGAGLRVVSFDGPSHGASDQGPAAAVVAHSLGAMATASALDHGLEAGRLAFVAPMAAPLPYTRTFAGRLGFGERTRERLVPRLERRGGGPPAGLPPPPPARPGAPPPPPPGPPPAP